MRNFGGANHPTSKHSRKFCFPDPGPAERARVNDYADYSDNYLGVDTILGAGDTAIGTGGDDWVI